MLIILILLPVTPEILGAIIFNYKCDNLSPSKHFIPENIDRELLFDSQGNVRWQGASAYGEWKKIEEKIHGNESYHDDKRITSTIISFPTKIVSEQITYKNTLTGSLVRQFEKLNSKGSWLNKFFGNWIQYQCFSLGWSVPNSGHLVFE